MALLLGPPSSGKTTLLLALAGKLDPSLKVIAPSSNLSVVMTTCVASLYSNQVSFILTRDNRGDYLVVLAGGFLPDTRRNHLQWAQTQRVRAAENCCVH